MLFQSAVSLTTVIDQRGKEISTTRDTRWIRLDDPGNKPSYHHRKAAEKIEVTLPYQSVTKESKQTWWA